MASASSNSIIMCSVINCKNSSQDLAVWKKTVCVIHNVNHEECPCQLPYCLYKFPRNEVMKQKWIEAINRKHFTLKLTSVVCSKHFITSRPTNENPTPCLDLGYINYSNQDDKICANKIQNITLVEGNISDKLVAEGNTASLIGAEDVVGNKDELFIAIVHSACNSFTNLKMCILKEKSLLSIEISKDIDTVFFPAIGGSIPMEGCDFNLTNDNLATAEIYSEGREENAVVNPLKILVASRSWSANLIAFGRKIIAIDKIANKKDLWEVEKGFIEILRSVSSFGVSDIGGFKLCCGITEEEQATITDQETESTLCKRMYPGGGYVYEDYNCSMLIEIFSIDQLKFPYLRCEMCKQRLNTGLKRNLDISDVTEILHEKKFKISNVITIIPNSFQI